MMSPSAACWHRKIPWKTLNSWAFLEISLIGTNIVISQAQPIHSVTFARPKSQNAREGEDILPRASQGFWKQSKEMKR